MLEVQPHASVPVCIDRNAAASCRKSAAVMSLLTFALAARLAGATPVFTTTVPGAAHTPGALGTMWLSDLHLSNPATRAASATVKFISAGGTLQRTVSIPASGSLMMSDVVAQLGGSGGGVLGVEADQYLIVGHRSYNAAASGTYGQYISSLAPNIGPQYVTGMRGGSYRTNLGLYNASASVNNVRIRTAGGTDRTETLAPYESRQLTGVQTWTGFSSAGDSAALDGTGPFLSYVSVIDNATGDPTYFPGLPLKSEGVLAGISHAPGANSTVWRSDAYLYAPSGAEVSLTFVRTGTSGAGVAPQLQVSLAPGATAAYEDLVAQLGVGDAFGVLWFKATRPVLAVARTYNLAGTTTYGQSILPVSQSDYVATGSAGLFLFASKSSSSNSGSRANLAIVNASSSTQNYTAEVLGPDGSIRGQVAIGVPPLSMMQQSDVVGAAGLSSLADCVVRVRGNAPFTGYLSVVDNRTGDASTVPPGVQDWERLTTQSVGPGGGTVSASGIDVTIPAGVLASATDVSVFRSSVAVPEFDRYRVTDVYGIDGVDSFDVSLSITRNGPGVGNPYIAFQETFFSPSAASMTSAPLLVAANVEPLGGGVKASALIDSEVRSQSARRAAPNADAIGDDVKPSQVVWAMTGYYEVKSASGKFLVRYPVYDVFSGSADEIAATLDASYSAIGGLGIDWSRRTRWPVVAQLIPFAADKDTRLAEEAPSKLGINYHWIDVNLHHLASPADLPEMRAATGHELMHLAQFLYDPRNRYSMAVWPGAWFWMNEATAVWFEGLVRGNPSQVSDIARANYPFLIGHGLEYPPGDPTDVQDHGYGASMFIQQIAALKGNSFVGDLIKQESNSTQTPVGALETLTTFGSGSQWKIFAEKYASGTVASGFPTAAHMGSLAAGHRGVLDTAAPPPLTFNFTMGDLSAWAGRAELRFAWPAGTSITIKHTDPAASSRLIVYKQSGGTLTELARNDGGGTLAIAKADELGKASVALFFWVSNARASQPFTGLTPMSIQVSVSKSSTLPDFPDGTYQFRTGTVGGCAGYSMGDWLMTAAGGSLSLKYGRNVSNVGVSGNGSVMPNPAGGYLWNLPWNYSYTAPDSQTENITANGTFDGFRLKGTLVRGTTCRVDFTDVNVTLVKQ